MISLYISDGVSESRYGDSWNGEVPVVEECKAGWYYNVRIGNNFSTYSLVDKAKPMVLSLQVSTSAIIVDTEDRMASPVEILDNALKAYRENTLEGFLDRYRLVRRWGRVSVMSGVATAYVSAGSRIMASVLNAIELSYKFKDYASVTFGEIPSIYEPVPLTQADLDRHTGVNVEVFNRMGESEFVNMPSNGIMLLTSNRFGFSKDIYENVVIRFSKEDIFKSLLQGCDILKFPGAEVVLMPTMARVQVSFFPPKISGKPELSRIAEKTEELTADIRVTLPVKKLGKRKRADFMVRQIGVNSEYIHRFENVGLAGDDVFDRATLKVPRVDGTQIVVEVGRFPEYIIKAHQIDKAKNASWQCIGDEDNYIPPFRRVLRSFIPRYNTELPDVYFYLRYFIIVAIIALLLMIK